MNCYLFLKKTKIINTNTFRKIIELFTTKNIFKISNKIEKILIQILTAAKEEKQKEKNRINVKIKGIRDGLKERNEHDKIELLEKTKKIKLLKEEIKKEKSLSNVLSLNLNNKKDKTKKN